MVVVIQIGLVGKDIPYEAQIIRVADEFEAITAKRQYKTHVGIIETLNILINQAKPNRTEQKNAKFKLFSPSHYVGKIDKKILKALFKVIIDDTEYEITARSDYLEFLKDEIKRLKSALKYYDKMQATSNVKKKELYKQEAKTFLHSNENVDKIPMMIEEFKKAYDMRRLHIDKLYHEVKQIKQLTI